MGGLQGVSLISAAAAAAGGVQGFSANGSRDGCASMASAELSDVAAMRGEDRAEDEEAEEDREDLDMDADGAEPAYLDDDEDDEVVELGAGAPCFGNPGFGNPGVGAGIGGPMQSSAQWSFFSQNNWMTGRRVQEFGDDPTIAARLAAAKRREEERRQQNKSKLGQLSA